MSSLVLLALVVNAAAVALQDDAAPKLTSFEMGCYYKAAPFGEKGGDLGRSYRGLVSYTVSGRTCKNWASKNKWKGAVLTATPDIEEADGIMKWGNGLGNHNYCRNPDPDEGFDEPWCFTTDPKREKEACNIDLCPAKEQKFTEMAKELAGTMKSGMSLPDCLCPDHVYGSTVTTMDTSVKFLQSEQMGRTKDGKPCSCRR